MKNAWRSTLLCETCQPGNGLWDVGTPSLLRPPFPYPRSGSAGLTNKHCLLPPLLSAYLGGTVFRIWGTHRCGCRLLLTEWPWMSREPLSNNYYDASFLLILMLWIKGAIEHQKIKAKSAIWLETAHNLWCRNGVAMQPAHSLNRVSAQVDTVVKYNIIKALFVLSLFVCSHLFEPLHFFTWPLKCQEKEAL